MSIKTTVIIKKGQSLTDKQITHLSIAHISGFMIKNIADINDEKAIIAIIAEAVAQNHETIIIIKEN